ncbi:MAG: DUF63 family protein [Candidatus Aenigmatarchaeota archaeon]
MNFLDKYFVYPIIEGTGYNIVNTLAYSLILVFAVILIYKTLRKLDVTIDKNFFIGLFPFIVLGGLMRALEDGSYFNSYLFVTPCIYIVLFSFGMLSLLISLFFDKHTKYPYWKMFFVMGIIPLIYFSFFVNIVNPGGLFLVVLLSGLWFVLLYSFNILNDRIFSKTNIIALWGHMLDASATFVAVSYFSYMEQHVLPNYLFKLFGPVAMFPLKFFVVLYVLYLLDRNIEDRNMKYWLKIVIFVLGFSLGVRDLLALSMLV